MGGLIDIIEPTSRLADLISAVPDVGGAGPALRVSLPQALTPRLAAGSSALYVGAPLTCREPMTAIRDLYLAAGAEIDAATARCFDGLVNLRVETLRPVQLKWFPRATITGLYVRDASILDVETLRETNVERLGIQWSSLSLTELPESTKSLTLTAWATRASSTLNPIWALPRLEALRLVNIKVPNLRAMSRLEHLSELQVWPRSFDGIEGFRALRRLSTGSATQCPPIKKISLLSSLRALEIRSRKPPADLDMLGALSGLEELSLTFGDIHSVSTVALGSFLKKLTGLRRLKVFGVRIDSGEVGELKKHLPRLESVEVSGRVAPSATALREQLRGIERVVVTELGPGAAENSNDELVIRSVNGVWTLFQDVSSLLGVKSNLEAENAVKAKLKAVAPGVLRRLDFDSEADSFSVSAPSKEDIEAVAGVVREMAHVSSSR